MSRLFRSFGFRLAILAALLAFVPGLSSRAFAQAGVKVEQIKFEGNQRFDADTLRLSMRTKQGQLLDRALLEEDKNTLYGFFDTVEIREEPTENGVRLIFVVTENPVVRRVDVQGVLELPKRDVLAVIETGAGRPLADFRLDNDARKVERLYRGKGFHFVEVATSVADADGEKAVTISVREGPKVSVDEIRFRGNDSRTDEDLREHMATKQSGFLGLRNDDFVEETLELDLLTLRNYYRSEGWLDATVQLIDLTFSEDRSEVIVDIGVEQGPAYQVGRVQILGGDGFPGGTEALNEYLRIESGTRRRQMDVSGTVSALEEAYRGEGFFAVRVTAAESLGAEGNVVDLAFSVEEQAKVRVRRLDIVGNTITQDKVIRRELPGVYSGAVLNQNEIDKGVNNLRGLGFFQHVGARVRDITDGDPDEKDVVIELDDTARTGSVRFALGISSDLGFIGSITLQKRNFDWKDWPDKFGDVFDGRAFSGAGQTFLLELSPGSSFSSYRLAFTEPWLFDKPISFGWDLFLTEFSRFDYDVEREGINFSLGRRWTYSGKKRDTVLGLTGTTRLENHEIDNVDRDSAPTAFLAEDKLSLISEKLSLRVDQLDNRLEPTSGWFAQATTEIGFGGDVQLWRNGLEGRHYWVVATDDEERDHIFSLGAEFAYAQALSGSEEAKPNLFDEEFVPIYERYRAGGGSSIRGFEFGGVGPHGEGDPFLAPRGGEIGNNRKRLGRLARTTRSILENEGDPIGGDVLFTSTAEYTFPLLEDVIRGVLFADAGLVRHDFDSTHGLDEGATRALQAQLRKGGPKRKRLAAQLQYDDENSFFSDTRVAVGFGVRLKIPFFGQQAVALDFGFPVRDQDGDDHQVLAFSLARDF